MRSRRLLGCSGCALLVLAVVVALSARGAAGSQASARWIAAVGLAPGRVVLSITLTPHAPAVTVLPDGKIVLAGTDAEGRLVVVELERNGRLNPSFGAGGVSRPNVTLQPWSVLVTQQGRLLVLGPRSAPSANADPRPDWQILRLKADGARDPSFGVQGVVDVSGVQVDGDPWSVLAHTAYPRPARPWAAPALDPNGDILLPTISGHAVPDPVSGLARLTPDGARDPSFGDGGIFTLPAVEPSAPGITPNLTNATGPQSLLAFSVRPDSSITLLTGGLGYSYFLVGQRFPYGGSNHLLRLTADGRIDPSFDRGLPVSLNNIEGDGLLVGANGAMEVTGIWLGQSYSVASDVILRFTADGAPDPNWGADGAVNLGGDFAAGSDRQTFVTTGSATLVVSTCSPHCATLDLVKRTATGTIDPTFGGPSGLAVALPFGARANRRAPGFKQVRVIERADGTLIAFGLVAVHASREYPTGWGLGISALNRSYRLDTNFGGRTPSRRT